MARAALAASPTTYVGVIEAADRLLVRSNCTTRASVENRLPWRTVQWSAKRRTLSTISALPQPCGERGRETAAIPTQYGLPVKSPCPIALVASNGSHPVPRASECLARACKGGPPATMAGRCARASRSATAATETSDGPVAQRWPVRKGGGPSGKCSSTRSIRNAKDDRTALGLCAS